MSDLQKFYKELGWDEPEYGWTKEKKALANLLSEQKKEIEESYKKGRLKGSYTREEIRSKCCDDRVYIGSTIKPGYYCKKCNKNCNNPEGIYFI